MSKVLQIQYAKATSGQLKKAKIEYGKTHPDFLCSQKLMKALEKLKFAQKVQDDSFYKNGRPTPVGIARKLQELKELGLSAKASIQEILDKKCEIHLENTKKMIERVHKHFDGSYSPPRQS